MIPGGIAEAAGTYDDPPGRIVKAECGAVELLDDGSADAGLRVFALDDDRLVG